MTQGRTIDLEEYEVERDRSYLTESRFTKKISELESLISNLKKTSKNLISIDDIIGFDVIDSSELGNKQTPLLEKDFLTEEEKTLIEKINSKINLLHSQIKPSKLRPTQEARNRASRLKLIIQELQNWKEKIEKNRLQKLSDEISNQEEELSKIAQNAINGTIDSRKKLKSKKLEIEQELSIIENLAEEESTRTESIARAIESFREDLSKLESHIDNLVSYHKNELTQFEKSVSNTTQSPDKSATWETLYRKMLGRESSGGKFSKEVDLLIDDAYSLKVTITKLRLDIGATERRILSREAQPIINKTLEITEEISEINDTFESNLKLLESELEAIEQKIQLGKFDPASSSLIIAQVNLDELNEDSLESISKSERKYAEIQNELTEKSHLKGYVYSKTSDLKPIISSLRLDQIDQLQKFKRKIEKIKKNIKNKRVLTKLNKSISSSYDKIEDAISEFDSKKESLTSSMTISLSILNLKEKDLIKISDTKLNKIKILLESSIPILKETLAEVQTEVETLSEIINSSNQKIKDETEGDLALLKGKLKDLKEIVARADSSIVLLSTPSLEKRREDLAKKATHLKTLSDNNISTLRSLHKSRALESFTKSTSIANPADELLIEMDEDDFKILSRRLKSIKPEFELVNETLEKTQEYKRKLHELSELLDSDENITLKNNIDKIHSSLSSEYSTTTQWWHKKEPIIRRKLLIDYWRVRKEDALQLKSKVEVLNIKTLKAANSVKNYRSLVSKFKTEGREISIHDREKRRVDIISEGNENLQLIEQIIDEIESFQRINSGWFETTMTRNLDELKELREQVTSEINLTKSISFEEVRPLSLDEGEDIEIILPEDPHLKLFNSIKASVTNQLKTNLEEEIRDLAIDELETELDLGLKDLDPSLPRFKQKYKDWNIKYKEILSEIISQQKDIDNVISECKNFLKDNPTSIYSPDISRFTTKLEDRRKSLIESQWEKLDGLARRLEELASGEKEVASLEIGAQKIKYKKFNTGKIIGAIIGIAITTAVLVASFVLAPTIGIAAAITAAALTATTTIPLGIVIGHIADKRAEKRWEKNIALEKSTTLEEMEKGVLEKSTSSLTMREKLGPEVEAPLALRKKTYKEVLVIPEIIKAPKGQEEITSKKRKQKVKRQETALKT